MTKQQLQASPSATDLQFPQGCLYNLEPRHGAAGQLVSGRVWSSSGCRSITVLRRCFCSSCPALRTCCYPRPTTKQVEGVQSAEQALQACRLTLNLLLETLLALLLLLALQLLVYWQLLATDWAGVMLQQGNACFRSPCKTRHVKRNGSSAGCSCSKVLLPSGKSVMLVHAKQASVHTHKARERRL